MRGMAEVMTHEFELVWEVDKVKGQQNRTTKTKETGRVLIASPEE